MSRSTLSISAGLAVAAVVLAGLWVSYGPRPHASRDRQASTTIPVSKQDRSGIDPQGETIRSVYPGPSSGSAQRVAPAPRTGAAAPAVLGGNLGGNPGSTAGCSDRGRGGGEADAAAAGRQRVRLRASRRPLRVRASTSTRRPSRS